MPTQWSILNFPIVWPPHEVSSSSALTFVCLSFRNVFLHSCNFVFPSTVVQADMGLLPPAWNLNLTETDVTFCVIVMRSTAWTWTLTHEHHRSTWDAEFVLQFRQSPRLAGPNKTSAEKDSVNVPSLQLMCPRCCQVIALSFWVFSTQGYADQVLLFDGVDTFAPLFASLSGSLASSQAHTSTQRYMYVRFTSDGEVTDIGFNATYESSLGKSVAWWCVLNSA
jgi:CUB domain